MAEGPRARSPRSASEPGDARRRHLADRVRVPRRVPGHPADRPPGGLDLRVGARPRGHADVRERARDRPRVRRVRVRRRHRRRPGRDGGRESWLPGGGRPVGRLQHRAAPRAGAELVVRHRADLRPLLRAQGDVREGGRGVRDLPRRVRHAGRALGGADADPDGEDRQLPGRALRLRLLGRAARLGAQGDARGQAHLARGRRAAVSHGRPGRRSWSSSSRGTSFAWPRARREPPARSTPRFAGSGTRPISSPRSVSSSAAASAGSRTRCRTASRSPYDQIPGWPVSTAVGPCRVCSRSGRSRACRSR